MEDQRLQGPMDCDCMDMDNCPHYPKDPRDTELRKHDIVVGEPEVITLPQRKPAHPLIGTKKHNWTFVIEFHDLYKKEECFGFMCVCSCGGSLSKKLVFAGRLPLCDWCSNTGYCGMNHTWWHTFYEEEYEWCYKCEKFHRRIISLRDMQ